jgi:hypothetical protein
MRTPSRLQVAAVAVPSLALAACAAPNSGLGEASTAAAQVKLVGAGISQVRLSESAYRHLGIQTTTLRRAPATGGAPRLTVPASAIFYDANGRTWVYTSVAARTYQRSRVTVDRFKGNTAVLTSGPAVGTTVVTVGVQELFGAEEGVDGE